MRALVSTSDKTGLIEFLKPLAEVGLEIVSTGGTYDYLKKNGFAVTEVAEVTSFPEVLDGRVKTLHPFIHMGLLADKHNPEHMRQLQQQEVKAFDMVVGNLYPFEKTAQNKNSTFEELIENIDIGGPSFLRASAKNYNSVIVVCSPDDYSWVQNKVLSKSITSEDKKKLALKVFSMTAYYDSMIVHKLCEDQDSLEYLNLPLKKKMSLRYGENAHQKASWYFNPLSDVGLNQLEIHQGKELSYNNILDLEAAIALVGFIEQPGCVAVKHNNPCGAAVAKGLYEAAQKAILADPKSIFGGIVAFNETVDIETCKLFKDIFLECFIAPAFTSESLQYLSSKKNLRVLSLASMKLQSTAVQRAFKSVSGGLLLQEEDSFNSEEWQFLGEKPSTTLMETMSFGEKVAASLKSNAIAIVANGQTLGLGMGQVNRVDAVKHALERMRECKARVDFSLSECVLISDAFFPFSDSIDLIAQFGIKWIVQPGGSVQDEKVFQAAKNNNINMVLTKRRHFKH
jgi:phosphoribosylaminoimidazolecarboxamide formyltransferase / IMP cyclohydrolase